MLVLKFGGTSVADAEAMRRVADIVEGRRDHRPLVVSSATAKTTDELLTLAHTAARRDREKVDALIDWLMEKHLAIVSDLGMSGDSTLVSLIRAVGSELGRITSGIWGRAEADHDRIDDCLSWGEYLSCNILAAYLRSRGLDGEWVDARKVFVTDSRFGRARPLVGESKKRARDIVLPLLAAGKVPVMQGFIGADAKGQTTTFGRGGSDYSATLVGAFLSAERVEIWTDVDGVMTANPSMVKDVRRLRRLTFDEAAELAYFGAKVLHPSTILPAMESGISVLVLNSMRPNLPGTEIVPRETARNPVARIKSIACKQGLSVINIKSTRMLMAYGFLASIFDIFNRYETAVDIVSTSEVSVSVTVDNLERIEQIMGELQKIADVEIRHGQAIVSLVGEEICQEPGLTADVFGELQGVQINLISQGASKINISFVIDETELPQVVGRLHARFFSGDLDEEIFDQ